MKSRTLFLLGTILALSCVSQQLYAQVQPAGKNAEFHNEKYFLQLAREHLMELLKQAQEQQQNEKVKLQMLSSKNDSLLALGNMYDSVSVGVSSKVLSVRQSFDSVDNVVIKFQQQINTRKDFNRNYLLIQTAVKATVKYVEENTLKNINLFQGMNLQLDTSNLGNEKGRLKGMLNAAAKQQEKEALVINKIDGKKDSLVNSGNVAPAIAGKLDNRLEIYTRRMDSLGIEIAALQQKVNSPKEFTKDFVLIKTKILLIDSIVNKKAVVREYIFSMINDGLSKSEPNLFSLAAFFGPGGFIIPESKSKLAKKYFSPIVDSLVKFSNDYATVMRTATITVNGYADGTAIGKGSKLFKQLAIYLNKPNPDKQELNAALSALRAEKISILLSQILKERFPDFKLISKIVFESNEAGMGEKFPKAEIKNYKPNDERRRIVIIYWNVLPAE
jgi:hypothetical protein